MALLSRSRRRRHEPAHELRRGFVPMVEALEDRIALSTYYVSNLNDAGSGSLRDAITKANTHAGSDIVRFASGLVGTVSLTSGQLTIADNLTVSGPGLSFISVDAGFLSRIFAVGAGTNVTISGLTMLQGRAPADLSPGEYDGGGVLNQGTLNVSRVRFRYNLAIPFGAAGNAFGGAIANYGTLSVDQSSFLGNGAVSSGSTGIAVGGAIANFGPLTVRTSSFTKNTAKGDATAWGGAVGQTNGGQLAASGCTFLSNTAVAHDGTPTEANTFLGSAQGGAIASGPASLATLENDSFLKNLAIARDSSGEGGLAQGGAVAATGLDVNGSPAVADTLTVDGCRFTSNLAQAGDGAPGASGASGHGTRQAQPDGNGHGGGQALGGGIVADSYTIALVTNSQFTHNQAQGGQGGQAGPGENGGNGYAFYSIFGALGGGIAVLSASLNVGNTTFTGNIAASGSGAAGAGGGNGGYGGWGSGGGIASGIEGVTPSVAPSVDIAGSDFKANIASGGDGGAANAQSGNGGRGSGGAIYSLIGSLSVSGTSFVGNQAKGGAGGAGQDAGAGGSGGNGWGGAIHQEQGQLSLDAGLLLMNWAPGGAGGTSGTGTNGAGGAGFGGGLLLATTGVGTVSNTTFLSNAATGGAGGRGIPGGFGAGGGIGATGNAFLDVIDSLFSNNSARGGFLNSNGYGGAIANDAARVTVTDSTVSGNVAAGGAGFPSGYGVGGGIYNQYGDMTLRNVQVTDNNAQGNAALGGGGFGGGLYINSGNVFADALTVIANNHADTGYDDVYGDIQPI